MSKLTCRLNVEAVLINILPSSDGSSVAMRDSSHNGLPLPEKAQTPNFNFEHLQPQQQPHHPQTTIAITTTWMEKQTRWHMRISGMTRH